jgi:hypothetical protein
MRSSEQRRIDELENFVLMQQKRITELERIVKSGEGNPAAREKSLEEIRGHTPNGIELVSHTTLRKTQNVQSLLEKTFPKGTNMGVYLFYVRDSMTEIANFRVTLIPSMMIILVPPGSTVPIPRRFTNNLRIFVLITDGLNENVDMRTGSNGAGSNMYMLERMRDWLGNIKTPNN